MNAPTHSWECEVCRGTVNRYRGQYDVRCASCGAEYNAGGQRLREGWRGNVSSWDADVDDATGYELQQLRTEAGSDDA